MRHEFAQAAREEFLSGVEYYELQQPGLGLAFSEQVQATVERILKSLMDGLHWMARFIDVSSSNSPML